jgi:hypothetical protein
MSIKCTNGAIKPKICLTRTYAALGVCWYFYKACIILLNVESKLYRF